MKTHEETRISSERSRCAHRVSGVCRRSLCTDGAFDDFRNEYFNDYHNDCQQRNRRNGLGPFFGPLLGKMNKTQNLNTVCHNRAVRHEVVNWYQQLPTDQKNALQNNLKEALNNWYNQLPQDQKDKLQSILNQTSETT